MKVRYILLVFFFITFISCQKQHTQQPVPQPIMPVGMPADTPLLKLKDMTEIGFPSPYYHFAYTDSGYISQVVFQDGLSFYNLSYTNKKVREMAMNKDIPFDTKKDKLEYDYNNGNLTTVRVIDKNGLYYSRCSLTFSDSRQLQKLEWDIKTDNADFVKEEIVQFIYYTDGNLETAVYQTFPVDPLTATTYQEKFENYDDKLNTDGFSLLHTIPLFLDLVLFPSVHLQMNNPHRVIHTGNGGNYIIDYTYTYDAKARPLTKTGDLSYTNGPNAGQHFNVLTTFSYYN